LNPEREKVLGLIRKHQPRLISKTRWQEVPRMIATTTQVVAAAATPSAKVAAAAAKPAAAASAKKRFVGFPTKKIQPASSPSQDSVQSIPTGLKLVDMQQEAEFLDRLQDHAMRCRNKLCAISFRKGGFGVQLTFDCRQCHQSLEYSSSPILKGPRRPGPDRDCAGITDATLKKFCGYAGIVGVGADTLRNFRTIHADDLATLDLTKPILARTEKEELLDRAAPVMEKMGLRNSTIRREKMQSMFATNEFNRKRKRSPEELEYRRLKRGPQGKAEVIRRRRPRRCSECKVLGHVVTHCPWLKLTNKFSKFKPKPPPAAAPENNNAGGKHAGNTGNVGGKGAGGAKASK